MCQHTDPGMSLKHIDFDPFGPGLYIPAPIHFVFLQKKSHHCSNPCSRSFRCRIRPPCSELVFETVLGDCSSVCDSSHGPVSFYSSALYIANFCCCGDHVVELSCQNYTVQSSFDVWYNLQMLIGVVAANFVEFSSLLLRVTKNFKKKIRGRKCLGKCSKVVPRARALQGLLYVSRTSNLRGKPLCDRVNGRWILSWSKPTLRKSLTCTCIMLD